MKRASSILTVLGLVLAVLYLVTALLTAPKFAVTWQDRDEALARIGTATNGKDASLLARPYLNLMMNVLTSAKHSLLISCGLVFFNGLIFVVNICAGRIRAPRPQQPDSGG